MKKLYFLISLFFYCYNFSYTQNNNRLQTELIDLSSIEKNFSHPDIRFRPCPLLVLNEISTKAEISRMVQELYEAGFGGFFFHPRPGLVTEYLSEEWFELYAYAIERAGKHNMHVWIYDENSYPSGFAGGHVPANYPESYNQGQGLSLERVTFLPSKTEDYYICLLKENDYTWTDITSSIKNYSNKEGNYYLYKKTYYHKSNWYGGFSYVDLLLPGITRKFIKETMSGYEKTIRSSFGKVVPGIFTDEPNIATSGGVRWTPDLFKVFKDKWGYDLIPYLPLLSEETSDWKKVRYHYMETLLQLFIDRWSKPWNEYTEKNNLYWTGHYWEHGWPDMNNGPDNMAMYAWHQMPGIDMLFNRFDDISPQAQFGNTRAVKELRSVANQMGYKRTLCETYGGGGWDVTFKDLKRLGDWEYVLGVNFMNQHLSHQTIAGARKYDYPPVFTYHSPWWNNYKVLNDYFARLSFLLSEGRQENNIVIIEPNSTLWSYFSHTGSNPRLLTIAEDFQKLVTLLEKNQVEFDLASENIIKDYAKIENGKFIIGKAVYTTVIIPAYTENISLNTFLLLQKFIQNGGEVICFAIPDKIDGIANHDIMQFMNSESVTRCGTLTPQIIEKFISGNHIRLDHKGGILFHQRRKYADGELVFLVNSSMEERTLGQVRFPEGKMLFELDAYAGKIYTYPSKKNGEYPVADFQLEPAGSLMLFIADKTDKKFPKRKQYNVSKVVPAHGKMKITKTQSNVLPIDFCDLVLPDEKMHCIHVSEAADKAFKAHGFDTGNPWNTSIQYKKNIIERDTFTTGGFSVLYHFYIDSSVDFSSFKLVAERPHFFKVKVNGQKITPSPGEWFLDRSFGVYYTGSALKVGKNEIELSVAPMKILAEIEPIYILGDFGVVSQEKGWHITEPFKEMTIGSWKKQRMPFYSWSVEYSKEYDLPKIEGNYTVQLGKWEGTVAEVFVNYQKVGIIGFEPYTLDITSYLHAGKNNLAIRIIGSHKNLLGPHYKNPDKGMASPWHWKNIKNPIPGNKYQITDYGLLEEFKLMH